MKTKWLIVGAGFTGATLAERIATQLNEDVLLVDKRNHIAGNAYDSFDAQGQLIHIYGPHIFHTNSSTVWDYLSRFTEWRPYFHHVLGVIEGRKVPIPFNLNSIRTLFPSSLANKLECLLLQQFGFGASVPILKLRDAAEGELRFLADYIYKNVFREYTRKQWELNPEDLDPSVTARVPVNVSFDDRYFHDTYQAMPRDGYSAMFSRMLDHPRIKILLNADFAEVADDIRYDRLIYTGPIDEYFNYQHGELPYRSLRFELEHLPVDHYQEVGTVNYPNNFAFTRITEFKYLCGSTNQGTTTIAKEFPERFQAGINTPYYPIPRKENQAIFDLYAESAKELDGQVMFAGRLGDYRYYNMDQAVARALKLFSSEVAIPFRARTRALAV